MRIGLTTGSKYPPLLDGGMRAGKPCASWSMIPTERITGLNAT